MSLPTKTTRGTPEYGHHIRISEPSKIVSSLTKPIHSNVFVWIETESNVDCTNENRCFCTGCPASYADMSSSSQPAAVYATAQYEETILLVDGPNTTKLVQETICRFCPAVTGRSIFTRWVECPQRVCAVTRRRFPVGARPTRRFAPAGSNRSSHGGNEMAEAFD